jgi:hypothetical protein
MVPRQAQAGSRSVVLPHTVAFTDLHRVSAVVRLVQSNLGVVTRVRLLGREDIDYLMQS